jgi:hypothetical protein
MSSFEIESLPIWRKVRFRLDAGKSVLLSTPRFCGEHRLLQHLSDHYRTQHKYRTAYVEVTRQPTTGDIDFQALWKSVHAGLGLRDGEPVSSDIEFTGRLSAQVSKRKSRLLLIIKGVQPGMERKFYELMTALHVIHARYGTGDDARFQFVAADEFLIVDYGYQCGIDWSQLNTVERESNTPLTSAQISAYLEGVSPYPQSAEPNAFLTARLYDHTGGHVGLLTELCGTLERDGWKHDSQYWESQVRPSLSGLQVLESLRAAIRDDKGGLAKTALDFVEPDYAVEYESPRFSMLRRLGILYRDSHTTLALVRGSIRTLMEDMAKASTEPRLGTVNREGGVVSFVEERYTPEPDDLVIVHLSDLHVGPDHAFRLSFPGKTVNGEVSSLATLVTEDLRDLGLLELVDGVVLSGDIVCSGVHSEFQRASEVVTDLLKKLGLSKERAILIPGNHDVQWEPGEFSATMAGNKQLSRDGYDMFLQLMGKEPGNLLDQVTLESRSGRRKLRIIGFDSNYVEGRSAAGIGFVGKESLEAAGRILDADPRKEGVDSLTWFVVHHHVLPVCDVSISEAQERRVSVMGNASQLLDTARKWGVEAILHGHQHQPAVAYTQRWIGETGPSKLAPIVIVGAGSCGAKRERLGPISYNQYFILARRKNSLLIRSRIIRPGAISFTVHDDLLIPMP